MEEWKAYYEKIRQGEEVRQNLIALKNSLKEGRNVRGLAYLLGGDFSLFTGLLKAEDPKIRKNAALILGTMESDDLVPVLVKAYQEEETLFVRSAYLKALEGCSYEEYVPYFAERLKELDACPQEEENGKHARDEAAALSSLLAVSEVCGTHTFEGYDMQVEVILLTDRGHREVTRAKIKQEKVTMLAGGIRFFTSDLRELWKIRTFREMLFPIPRVSKVSGTPSEIGEELACKIADYLETLHKEKGAFRFRTEMKGIKDAQEKADFARQFSEACSRQSGRRLLNNPSDYEVEIRLVSGHDGQFVPLLKLSTFPDKRFDYRREAVGTSIAPARAALIMELSAPWLKEGAQVLDPFCGVGTMLVERAKFKQADPLYGIDIYGEAIEKGRENAKRAELPIHFINRNCLEFKHSYLFDEIISDLPLVGKTRNRDEIRRLYEGLFERIGRWLKEGGILVLYTSEETVMDACLRKYPSVKLLQKFLIQEKTKSQLYILQYEKQKGSSLG